ncbi:MAG: methylmalonyl-CoA epimerase [Bacteroidia bacterium]|nr:methylmalonyl-CoA epimerase [Bacteroidia bacterium]MDW8158167.1 methylmalonyl-CoA epimerase [Bacteroidia bacterium]
MLKIEHIGIAIQPNQENIEIFNKLLSQTPYKAEIVESEGVKTTFFQVGESKIELLEATQSQSPIAKFLEKRGGGIHHIALEVDSLEQEIQRLQSLGFELINPEPKKGADNKLIVFLHPKSTANVLVELCQSTTPLENKK